MSSSDCITLKTRSVFQPIIHRPVAWRAGKNSTGTAQAPPIVIHGCSATGKPVLHGVLSAKHKPGIGDLLWHRRRSALHETVLC